MILQKLYISILNGFFRITGRINGSLREALVFACFLVFALIYAFKAKTGDISGRMEFSVVLVSLMTVLSVKDELKPIKWNKYIYIPFVLFGAGILLVSRLHYVGEGYTLYALCLIFLLPAFYLVWINRGDYESLYKKIALAFIIAGMLCFIYCFYLAYNGHYQIWEGTRGTGKTGNPNYMGMIGLTTVLSSLYLLMRSRNLPRVIILGAFIGCGTSMIIESVSRAAMISAILSFIITVVFIFKRTGHDESGRLIKLKLVPLVLIVALIFTYIGLTVDDIQKGYKERKQAAKAQEAEEASFETGDEDSINLIDITFSGFTAYADDGDSDEEESESAVSGDIQDVGDRIVPDGSADEFSSGRLGIWKVYIKRFSLLGSDYRDLKEHKDEFSNNKVVRAHNNFVDYGFRLGIPVTLIYLWIYAYLGIRGLRVIFRKDSYRSGGFFSAVIIGTYALYALVEISDMPFVRCIPFLFFMVLAPYFEENSRFV